jgi:hypothetical protein
MSDAARQSMSESERAFAERAVRRKQLFRRLSFAGIAVAAGLAVFYGYERLRDPSFALGPRAVIILLILLNARQNLRQYRYAMVLEKLIARQ